jgi:AraC family L-rhamnose operon transcriptional activator RhaR
MREYKAKDLINHEENISFQKSFIDGEEQTHTHDFMEIVYISSGKGQHCINGISFDVERGDTLLINFGQTHSFRSAGQMAYVNCILLPEFMGRELINSENALDILALASFEDFGGHVDNATPKISFRGSEMIEIEEIVGYMVKEFEEKHIGYCSVLKGYICVFLAKIFREMRTNDTIGVMQHVSKISPDIIKYIEENCFEKITLEELAQKCFYNPSYFSKVFKECYGRNLTGFIHEKRVNAAMKMLKETSLSVEEICYRVGYKEKKQFYKIFRKYVGVTPRSVRMALKNQGLL